MRTELVSVSSVVDEWKSDTMYEQDISSDKLKRWANDTAAKLVTDEQLEHTIALLNVKDYKAVLPENFRFIIQAAYRAKEQGCVTREKVVEWSFGAMDGSGCKFKVNLECPECHQNSCSCNSTITTIDADVMWASSHPETQVAYMRHFYGFGGNTQRYGQQRDGLPLFKIMRAAQGNFFNSSAFLSGCTDFDVDNVVEYKVMPPSMIVNFKEGQVLLSYMGAKVDNEGWLMIPNTPYVFESIHYAIEEKMAHAEYRKKKDGATRAYWSDMLAMRDKTISRARNKLQIPDADEWMATMQNHFNKMRPYWTHETNFNRMERDKYHRPDETYS
jgi:hypothetical protein